MILKQRRLGWLLFSFLALGMAIGLLLLAASDTVTFFFSPSELAQQPVKQDRRLRVGGIVAAGSVQRTGQTIHFVITDRVHTVPVLFSGILPDLFREGQGVVAEGVLGEDGVLHAFSVLAKHDETYTPRDVAESLKNKSQGKRAPETATVPSPRETATVPSPSGSAPAGQ